jgi:AraC-like DNA-binding protein
MPPVPGVREVLHARFGAHAYPRHTHDTWTLFVVERGAIRYDLDRHAHGADRSMVSVLPPHVVHDGRPGSAAGYWKQVVYVETDLLGKHLIGPAVDRPVVRARGIRRQTAALHDALKCLDDALEAELRLNALAARIRESLGEAPPRAARQVERKLAGRLRDYLDAHLFEPVTMAAAATELGVGTTRLARAFTDAFGLPPHTYVTGRRIEVARSKILAGQPLADVAAEVGFFDQAHLTRRFTAFLGVTQVSLGHHAG